MKNKKKGFTIVELVIVIAVIGILAAILIPMFTGLISKANLAADSTLVKNINTQLAMAEVEDGKNKTMYDALLDAREAGYIVVNINARSENQLVWDETIDRFALINKNGELVAGEIKTSKDEKLWVIDDEVSEQYSTYYIGSPKTINTSKGFDCGDVDGITTINYTNNTSTAHNVVIRTNSVFTDININAPQDTINHYGEVGKVDIAKVDMNCYNEYGEAVYVKVAEGKVFAKDNGKINIVFADNNDGSKVAVLKDQSATINVGYTRVEAVDTINQGRTIASVIGIELKYAIYLDEDTIVAGDNFVNYVESSATYAVSTAKKVEEVAKQEKQNGPTGTFKLNDPFNSDYASMGDLVIVRDRSIRGTDYSLTYEPFTKFGDPYIFNDNYEELAESIYDACDESEEDEPVFTFTSTDLIEAEVDDFYDIRIRGIKVGSQDITFYVDGEEIGTVHIAVIVIGDDYSTESEDGQDVFEIDEEVKDVTVDANSHALVDVSEIANGATIKMLRSFNGQLDFKGYNNKTLILDLNGFAIKSLKIDSVTMTIIDSSTDKSGKVETLSFSCAYGVQNPDYAWDSFEDDVEINSCKDGQYLYLDVWFNRPAKLTLLGGSIKTLHLMYCGEVEIAGAQIINTDELNQSIEQGYALALSGRSRYMKITIVSGVLIGYKNFSNFGKATISGGYFSEQVPAQYLADGYTCVDISGGMYQVVANDQI